VDLDMENLTSRLWIALSLIGAGFWVVISVRDILRYDGSPTAIVILSGITAFGAIIIVALGALMCWYTDFVRRRSYGGANPAKPRRMPLSGAPRHHGHRWRLPTEEKAAQLKTLRPRNRPY
jgi:hypothetical protein